MSSGNLQVRARQLWGSDVYTEDSDLVAVLMHTGYYSISQPHAPPSIAEVCAALQHHCSRCSSLGPGYTMLRKQTQTLRTCLVHFSKCSPQSSTSLSMEAHVDEISSSAAEVLACF